MPRQDKQYNKTREDFDRMNLEDRAAFLIEATFSTAAEAIDRAGQELADFVEDLDREPRNQKTSESDSEASTSTESADSPSNSADDSSSSREPSDD